MLATVMKQPSQSAGTPPLQSGLGRVSRRGGEGLGRGIAVATPFRAATVREWSPDIGTSLPPPLLITIAAIAAAQANLAPVIGAGVLGAVRANLGRRLTANAALKCQCSNRRCRSQRSRGRSHRVHNVIATISCGESSKSYRGNAGPPHRRCGTPGLSWKPVPPHNPSTTAAPASSHSAAP